MIPAGYMAKHIYKRPNWNKAPHVAGIYSLSGCMSRDFADYIEFWKHNGYWMFDSPEIIANIAKEHSIVLNDTLLFYYELYEKEFDGASWQAFKPDGFATEVIPPFAKTTRRLRRGHVLCESVPGVLAFVVQLDGRRTLDE